VSVECATSAAEWDAYVNEHPAATCDHLWGWRRIFEDVFRQETKYLVARRDSRLRPPARAVQIASVRRAVISLPVLNYGGLLARYRGLDALLANAVELATSRASHLELRHISRLRSELQERTHKLMLVRPLRPGRPAVEAADRRFATR
jgi:hypothetical protein